MNQILASSFANVVTYKEGEFDFTANNGLTVVTGHNRDSRISKKQNNGAGKSLLFSMLPNVFWEATPLTQKKNRKVLVDSKESSISVRMQLGKHVYDITQQAGKYIIQKDGVDQQVHGLPGQQAYIADLMPLTKDEWYSYVYLQSQRSHAFQYGDPKARLGYITQVWNLDQYDRLHKYFNKQVAEAKKAQTEFDVHHNALTTTNDKINSLGWTKKHESELEEANNIIARLGDRVRELQDRKQELSVQQHLHEKSKAARLKLKKLKADAKFTKKELNALFKAHEAYSEYLEATEIYKSKHTRYTQRLKEIGVVKPANTKSIRKELESLRTADEAERKTRERSDEAKRILENLDDHVDPDLRAFLSKHRKTSTDPMAALLEERIQLKATVSLGDLLHDHEDGNCPTCKQSINIKNLTSQIKDAKKRLSKVSSVIHALEIRNAEAQATKTLKELDFDEDAYFARRKQIKKLMEQLDAVEDDADKYQESIEIKAKLDALEKPALVKKPKISEEELEKHVEIVNTISKLQNNLEETKDCSAELAEVAEKLKKIEKKYVKAFRMQTEYSGKKASYDLLNENREGTMKELDKLQPIIKKLGRYRLLAKAYGPSGLKLSATNDILFQLEQTYNQYRHLIFAEPFKFKVLTKTDGVHILVDRGDSPTSDVRQLSGAESDSFALLHFLACLVLAPPHKRLNLAILDEPDSHMDDATATLFANHYLPFLRSMVPHIFLITQKGKDKHSDCTHITVEKRKGVSTIKNE